MPRNGSLTLSLPTFNVSLPNVNGVVGRYASRGRKTYRGVTRQAMGRDFGLTTVALQIAVVVLLILLSGLFAMSETALVSISKARLKQRAESGAAGARAALELSDSPNRFLSTVQIGISMIGVLAGALGGAALAKPLADALRAVPVLAPYAGTIAFVAVVAGITYLSLILGELVPKRLALNAPETVASRVAPPMSLLSFAASPAVWFLGFSTDAVLGLLRVRPNEEPPVSEQEIEILLEEGAQAGVLEEEEKDLVARALRLDDRPVRELMTPRPDISWLDADGPLEEQWRRVARNRYSYYPVARGDLDEMLGVASIKDAIPRAMAGEPEMLLSSLRRPALVPKKAHASELLEAFERSGLPLALVIDERGNLEGLVTPTDVLEALVGNVADAKGPPEASRIARLADGAWRVDGILATGRLKAHLGLRELPREDEGDYQTVGGLVMDRLGRVPEPGDGFGWDGFSFKVEEMDGHRVYKVLVTKA